ncbi:MAG: hypothetical protein AAB426_05630 [Myxococcota bacterium]
MTLVLCTLLASWPLGATPKLAARTTDDAHRLRLDVQLDVSQLVGVDDSTARTLSLTDVRLWSDAQNIANGPYGLLVDARMRRSQNELVDDRWSVRQMTLTYGHTTDRWRVRLGRALVPAVASAEVDGAELTWRLSDAATAMAFGGLIPHPLTGDFGSDFVGAGLGYDVRGASQNHAGGLLASTYQGALDRAYVTQRSYVSLGQQLVLSAFVLADLVLPATADTTPDRLEQTTPATKHLTNAYALLRYRPSRSFDTSLTLSHNHTVLPNKWWQDWLSAQAHQRGYVLDGTEPVGTRLSSVRWTTNVSVSPTVVPYLSVRYDRRHNDDAVGYEARGGCKLRPRWGYADVSYAYRDYFRALVHTGSARVGYDAPFVGAEMGLMTLATVWHADSKIRVSTLADALTWVSLGALTDALADVRLIAQYQGFYEPLINYHTVFVQLGYRLHSGVR